METLTDRVHREMEILELFDTGTAVLSDLRYRRVTPKHAGQILQQVAKELSEIDQ